jgi:uncharacterized membrane protein YgcG
MQPISPSDPMPRAPAAAFARLAAILLPLVLAACAETLTSDEATSSATLQRDYDKTLTKKERDAAISDLQSASAKKQDQGAGN